MPHLLNNYFDKIYCINLDSRPDRWALVNRRFQQQGIEVSRFSAADGYSDDLEREFDLIQNAFETKQKKHPRYLKNPRALGCLLSVMQIIDHARSNGYQKILLFDDDVIFHKHFDQLLENLPPVSSWKLLYLGCSQHQWHDITMLDGYSYLARHTHGSFAVGIDASVFSEIHDLMAMKQKNCDIYLMEIQERYPDDCLVLRPNLVIADVRDSMIRDARYPRPHAMRVKWNLRDYHMDWPRRMKL